MAKPSRRFWTNAEIEIVRSNYKKISVAELARKLDRSKGAVYQLAKKLGLVDKLEFLPTETIKARILELHPNGITDTEIARILADQHNCGVDRHRVSQIRRSLGLKHNSFSDHRRNQVRSKTQEQLAKADLPNLAAVRVARFNQWKRDLGWPEHLTVRAVQSLEMFYQHGPLTRVQLCTLLGISHSKRTAPTSNAKGGTVLAELAAAGLISRAAKSVTVPFDLKLHDDPGGSRDRTTTRKIRTKSISLYFLNPGVEPNEHRKAGRIEAGRRRQPDCNDNQGHDELASTTQSGGR